MSEIVARSSLSCPIRFTVTSTVVVLVEAQRCRMQIFIDPIRRKLAVRHGRDSKGGTDAKDRDAST